MALDADDGPSYHRPRFRLVSGLSHDLTDPVGDARVELIVEMIVELSEERRDRLARRLVQLDGQA
jgi:hypothetical protein